MLWKILRRGKEEKGKAKGKKTSESFSLEFCKIDAVIPPDVECIVNYISNKEIIFKSPADLPEESQIPFRITYYPMQPVKGSSSVTLDAPLRILKKGQLAVSKFLYKAEYTKMSDGGLKRFFKYLLEVEKTQISKLVDYRDRREHFRVNRVLPVFSKNIRDYKCLTKNISTGGIMLACSEGIKKGDVLSLRLELDDYSTDAIQVNGEVCWVEDEKPGSISIGIKFLDIGDEERALLGKYIGSIRKRMEN